LICCFRKSYKNQSLLELFWQRLQPHRPTVICMLGVF
jgi:hypothetical protein